MPWYTPPQSTPKVRSHWARSSATTLPPPAMPALLNKRLTWSVANSDFTASRKASTCASSDTSATKVTTRVSAGASANANDLVSAIASSDTSQVATSQPAAASWRTSSRPMPVPPPVTTAMRPSSSSTT